MTEIVDVKDMQTHIHRHEKEEDDDDFVDDEQKWKLWAHTFTVCNHSAHDCYCVEGALGFS